MSLSIPARLKLVKTVHTAIYIVMVAAVFYTLYAALTRARGLLLLIALGLVGLEMGVFFGNGRKCPLTQWSRRYGGSDGNDTLLPAIFTHNTFWVYGAIFAAAVLILLINR